MLMITSCNTTQSVSSFRFHYSQATENDYQGEAYYSDDYFTKDSTLYDSSLATTSLSLAMASFASNVGRETYEYRYRNASEFLSNNGFENIDTNQYYKEKPTADSLGAVFGHKKIGNYTLLVCAVRGGGYEMEWASNFTIGDGTNPKQAQGFYEASSIYLSSIQEYIDKYNIQGDVKLWSVGYSRGGATNNLAIGRIDQEINKGNTLFNGKVKIKKEDIYCYCFEPPQGASYDEEISPRSEIYDNIHNIVNHNDPVPKVAMSKLRFTRYGVDYYLPDRVHNSNFSELLDTIKGFYNDMDNHSAIGNYKIDDFAFSKSTDESKEINALDSSYTRINWTSGLFLNEFIDELTTLGVQSRANYVENFQNGLREVFQVVYKNGAPKFSFLTLGVSIAKTILNSSDVDIMVNNLVHDTTTFLNDLINIIHSTLKSLGLEISIETLTKSLKNLLDAVLTVLINHMDYIFTLVNVSNITCIACGHYPELCLANLMAQDPNFTSNVKSYNSDGSYYYLEVPNITEDTQITIKNKKGKTVASLNKGIMQKGSISYGSKKKTFFAYIPVDEEYTISISNAESYKLSHFDQRQENMVNDQEDINISSLTFTTETYPEKKGA